MNLKLSAQMEMEESKVNGGEKGKKEDETIGHINREVDEGIERTKVFPLGKNRPSKVVSQPRQP